MYFTYSEQLSVNNFQLLLVLCTSENAILYIVLKHMYYFLLGIYLGIKFMDQKTHPSYLYLVMTLFFKTHKKQNIISSVAKISEFPYMCLLSVCCDILFSTDGNEKNSASHRHVTKKGRSILLAFFRYLCGYSLILH